MSLAITAASTPEHFAAFGELVREYAGWLSLKHAADAWFIESVLKHQSLEAELRDLPVAYAAPKGSVLLAWKDGEVAGGVALKPLSDDACEMKRMFVRDGFRGLGIGRELCKAVIGNARDKGYRLMQLDTSRKLTDAISLYKSFGFKECAPYRDYPPALQPHLLFMERLQTGPSTI